MAGEQLDIVSGDVPATPPSESGQRKFVGVHFHCCDIYTRVYLNGERTAYSGHCPKCAKRIRLAIGPGGTDSRFFSVK